MSSEFDLVPLNKVEEKSRIIPNINLRPLSSYSHVRTHTCSHTYAHMHINMDTHNYIKMEEMGSRKKERKQGKEAGTELGVLQMMSVHL